MNNKINGWLACLGHVLVAPQVIDDLVANDADLVEEVIDCA